MSGVILFDPFCIDYLVVRASAAPVHRNSSAFDDVQDMLR